MFWGININMKMVLGSVSVNYDRLLSDLAWFSLIFCRKRFLSGFYLPAFVEGTHESSTENVVSVTPVHPGSEYAFACVQQHFAFLK
jgi:hypothetical protein